MHKFNKNLEKYTENEIKNLSSNKITLAKNIEDISNFAKKELQQKTSNSKIFIGKINKVIANRIKKETNLNLENYNISLKGDNIRKIIKDHGNKTIENLRGQDAITIEDFCIIDDIILDADEIYLSGKTKSNKDVITFKKKNKNLYTIIEFVSTKRKTLETHTMYKSIKKNSSTRDNS